MTFEELLYNDELLDALYDMHFGECTPIQEKAIPVIEEGYDVLALAQTGTGKTAAYLLPVIDQLADGGYSEDAINCVVMAPTRELAIQIDQQMQGFSYFLPRISSIAIYGGTDGANFEAQKQALKKGADVVIATPGRLIAHMQMGYVDLSRVSFFVLDEADRMLDMGFVDDIKTIMSSMPKEKQTLMFSATISPKIKKLAQDLLVNHKEVKIALSKPPEAIDQQAYLVRERSKEALLKHIVKGLGDDLTIIFSSRKTTVKQLARALRSWKVEAAEIHSDLDQKQREATMLDFRSGRVKVLVATDIVARGIDIDNIATIINYDVPRDAEDYVHRIGRTARASATGRAITLVSESERGKFRDIERLIEKTVPKQPLPDFLAESGDPKPSRSDSHRDGKNRDNKNRSRKPKSPRPAKAGKPEATANPEKPEATVPVAENPSEVPVTQDKPKPKRRRWHHRGGGKKKGPAPAPAPEA